MCEFYLLWFRCFGWVFQYVCVMCILLSDSPAPYHSKSNYSLIETFLKSPQSLVDKIKTRNFTVTCILHSCVNKLQHHENTKTLHKQNCEKTNVIFQKYHIGGSKCIESQCQKKKMNFEALLFSLYLLPYRFHLKKVWYCISFHCYAGDRQIYVPDSPLRNL